MLKLCYDVYGIFLPASLCQVSLVFLCTLQHLKFYAAFCLLFPGFFLISHQAFYTCEPLYNFYIYCI